MISKDIGDIKTDEDILRISIVAELDAIILYEKLANKTSNLNLKKVLLDISKEEKTHVGEFQKMLKNIDSEFTIELENGEKEVEDLLKDINN